MARQKVVNGVYSDLTAEEEAELDAQAEAADLDMGHVRAQRNSMLRGSDWTQVADSPADADAWATYRQSLRDLPQTYTRVSEVVWPTPPE
tara:strand:- start:662 stop:931 length:270 start_codon:yes stop_codon:yes gene_type:complete